MGCHGHPWLTSSSAYAQHKTIFRYQPNWSSYDDVQRIVRKKWAGRTSGTPMFRLTRKLRNIKSELKTWSMSKFSNFRKQVEKETNKLHLVESKLIADPQSHRLNDWHF